MFEGYLCVGGTEIGNNARARGYAESADCPVDWFVCDQCEGLADAVGDEGYVLANISEAPWFDPDDESTSRFYGAYIVSLGEVSSSTRFGNYTEGIVDGGVPGRSRHTGKTFRVRAWLTADGEDALEAGQGWLDAALEANTCGTHSGGTCGASDATFFTACPPLRGLVPGFSPWAQEAENLFTNPNLVGTGGTVNIYENLFTNPSFEAGAGMVEVQRNLAYDPGSTSSASFGGFAGTGNTGMGEIAPSAWSISGDAYRRTWTTRPNADGAVGYRIGSLGFTPDELFTIVVRFQVSHPSRVSVGPGGAAGTGRVLGASSPAIDAVPGVTHTHWMTASWTTVGADTRISLTAGDSSRVDGYWIEVGDALAYPGEYDASRLHFVPGYPSPDPDLTPSWTGTANTSESVLTGVLPAGFGYTASQVTPWVHTENGETMLRVRLETTNAIGIPFENATPTQSEPYTLLGEVRPAGKAQDAALRVRGEEGAVQTFPADVWTEVRETLVASDGSSITTGLVMRGNTQAPGDIIDIRHPGLFEGTYTGPWFDGDHPLDDPDFTTAWTGAANASTTLVTGEPVAGMSTSSCLAIRSSKFGGSMRLIATNPGSSASYAYRSIPVGAVRDDGTIMATLHLEAPLTGTISSNALSIRAQSPAQSVSGVNEAGSQPLRYHYEGLTSNYTMWFYHGGRQGSGDVYWTAPGLFAGDYTGPWFSGDTEDTDLERYRWTGTPNNSSSLYDTRDAIERMQTDEEYEATVAPLVRHMHDVICISGPLEIETRRSRDGIHWGRLVEFTLYAGKPWLYGETKQLDLSPTPATVVQDIPYNLILTPSAELPGDPVVVATNYSLNPSLEANATGWTVNFSSWSGDDPVSRSTSGRVTGELAAAGVASMRTRLLGDATAASGRAQHSVSQMVDITGRPNDARMSATIWGALINVGAATGTTLRRLHAHCDWYNASNVVIDSVLLGDIVDEGAFGGHVFSQKSMMPPAAATQALITVTGEFDWSSGTNKSDIRLYVDALALTVP